MTKSARLQVGSWLVLLAVLLLAFGLRLYHLTAQSVWWDEGISLNLARLSLADIAADRVNNIHPPLYFILLKLWTNLTGLNAFNGRYFSVLASFLQVAAVFAVSRRWFRGKQSAPSLTAWIALILITLSPLSVIYGQEIRVYALLPLISLALLALAWQMSDQPPLASLQFVWLGVVEWLGIHLHYVAAFVIAYVVLWLLLVFGRGRRWRDLRRFLLTQAVVGLASLPWFLAVLRNWTAVQAEANAGTYLTDPVPLDFLLKQVWVFHHTGLAGALGRPLVWNLALLILGLTAVLLLWRIWQQAARKTAVRLLLQWLLPLAGALLVWSVRSFSHPRYISFTAVGFIILAAYLMVPKRETAVGWWRLLKLILPGMLFVSLVVISLLGLNFYFFDSNFSKDDMRGVARLLEETATADDLIIIPDTDWSLPFEYEGAAEIVMPGLPNRQQVWLDMESLTAVPRRVFTVAYAQGNRDWQNVVPFVLEAFGSPIHTWQIEDLEVREYQISQTITPPNFVENGAQFGPLQLRGVWLEPQPMLNTAVAVALQWQLLSSAAARYQVKLRLLDSDGFVLAETSEVLLAEDGRPTNLWQTDQSVASYHHIPLPPGTAPGPFRVEASVFSATAAEVKTLAAVDSSGAAAGQQVVVAEGVLGLDTAVPASVYGVQNSIPARPESFHFSDGLLLVGAVLERTALQPGQPLFVHLQWQAERPLPALKPVLNLEQNGEIIASAASSAALENYPANLWLPGWLVNDQRRLQVPAAAEGTAVVTLVVGEEQLTLAEIDIAGQPRQMRVPQMENEVDAVFGEQARLVGFDLTQTTAAPGEEIALTLYWQALQTGSATEYKVFVHLLAADGRLLSQDDAVPNRGQNPSTGWLEGEYITDPHTLLLPAEETAVSARLAVGLYNPQTNERLLLADGRDHIILPLKITIQD